MKKTLLALLFATTILLPFNTEARTHHKPVYLMTEEEKEEYREEHREAHERGLKKEIEEATEKYNELPSFDGLKEIMVYQHTALGGELILTYEDNTEVRFCHYRIYNDEHKCVRIFKLKEEYGNDNFYYVTRQGLFKVNIDENKEVETIYLIDEVNVDFTEQHYIEDGDYLGLTEIKPIFNKYNVDFGTDWYGYYYGIREKVLEGIK